MTATNVLSIHGEMKKVYVPAILTGVTLSMMQKETVELVQVILATVTINARVVVEDPQPEIVQNALIIA